MRSSAVESRFGQRPWRLTYGRRPCSVGTKSIYRRAFTPPSLAGVRWRNRSSTTPPVLRWRITGYGLTGGRGNVVSRDVGLQHLSGGEPLDTHGQRGLHDLYPGGGYFARDAIIELRYYFLLEQTEQMLHVPLLGVGLGTRQGNRPAILPREPLGPPAIERAQLWNAVERRLHAAGTAGFERHARQVDPHVHTRDHALREMHFVILEERNSSLETGILRGRENPLQHALPRIVRGMRLAGEDDLDRAARVGQQSPQPLGVAEQQVGSLVGCKAPGESEGQHVGREERPGCRKLRRFFPVIPPTVTRFLADVMQQQVPQTLVRSPQPVIIQRSYGRGGPVGLRARFPICTEGCGEQLADRSRHPGAEVDAVRDVPDGDLFRGPVIPDPTPDAARFFLMPGRYAVHATRETQ